MGPIVYLVRDLVFVSKIRATAEQCGVPVEGASDPESLQVAAKGARLVIIDLRLPDSLRALELLARDPDTAGVPSVGFVDHEKRDVMETASALGCGTVLAKGRFASELPRLVSA